MIGRMMDREKKINEIALTIRGEINRMCATSDIAELDIMAHHAIENIKKLRGFVYEDLVDIAEMRSRYARKR